MKVTGNHKTSSFQFDAEGLAPALQRTAGIRVETIKDSDALSRIETEWRDLCSRAPEHDFFQTFTWVWPWWKYLGQPLGYELHIVTVRMDGRLVLIWPLVARKQGLWRVGGWLGTGSGQYGDLVIEEGPDRTIWFEAAWRAITTGRGIDVLHLEGIREDAVVRRFLIKKKGRIKVTSTSPYVDICKWQDWDAFHTGLKRGFRRNLQRTRRRLNEKGQLVHRFIEDPMEFESIVTRSISLKLNWLKKRNTYGRLLEKPELERWLNHVVLAAQRDSALKMSTLSLDDSIIATQIGFLHHGHYYSYFGSFDTDYTSLQPGKVETTNTLMWAFENGVETFDLMPPADDYKLDWARHEATVVIFDSYPTVLGRLGKVWYGSGLRDKALWIYGRLPRRFRRFVVRLFAI